MIPYLYRRGNGNEGDYPRFIVVLNDDDCPYAALAALVENDYIVRHKARRHVQTCIATDGDPEHGISAVVYDPPEGGAYDHAWLTAQLEPLRDGDLQHYRDQGMSEYRLREILDGVALRRFRRDAKLGRA